MNKTTSKAKNGAGDAIFQERLIQLRRKVGSWKVLAGKMGYSKSYINQIKNGKYKPTNNFMKSLNRVWRQEMDKKPRFVVTVPCVSESQRDLILRLKPARRRDILLDAAWEMIPKTRKEDANAENGAEFKKRQADQTNGIG
ncbi:MAG: hypothetical protein K940chlam2_01688 [Chlamydiae bacterium]|nr:hypothetical protein [Chlamydiota bacterium]